MIYIIIIYTEKVFTLNHSAYFLDDEENYLMLSRVSDVNKRFPDIPEIFHFGLSTVQFGTVGVFCSQSLNKGIINFPVITWIYM